MNLSKLIEILNDLENRYWWMDFEICRDPNQTRIKTKSLLMAFLIEDSLNLNGFRTRVSYRLDGSIHIVVLEDGNEVGEWFR